MTDCAGSEFASSQESAALIDIQMVNRQTGATASSFVQYDPLLAFYFREDHELGR